MDAQKVWTGREPIVMVANRDTGEVGGVFLPSERQRASNLASRLYHTTGQPWTVTETTLVPVMVGIEEAQA